MSESTQHKLDRVRKPRVQITYDVEIGDATVKLASCSSWWAFWGIFPVIRQRRSSR